MAPPVETEFGVFCSFSSPCLGSTRGSHFPPARCQPTEEARRTVLSETHKRNGNVYLLTHPLGLSDLLRLSESARQGGHRLIVCPEAWKRTGQIKNTCSNTVKHGSNQSMCLASSSPGLQPAVWSPLLGPEGREQGGAEQVGQGLGVEDSRGFFSRLTFAC